MASKYAKEEPKEDREKRLVTWDDCPNEILLMILEMIPLPGIAICMFVNSKWNSVCQYILDVLNLWPALVDIHIPRRGELLQLKSNRLTWNQIYRNGMLWNNLEKASYHFGNNPIVDDSVIKLNVYRDNLIILNANSVRYFGIPDFKLKKKTVFYEANRKEFAATHIDFVENDFIIVEVSKLWDDFKIMKLNGKYNPNGCDIGNTPARTFDGVVFYRIIKNQCYMMTKLGILWKLTYNHPEWTDTFMARYFGSPDIMCGFNVYNDSAYLWITTGSVLIAYPSIRCFKAIMDINMPYTEVHIIRYHYMFHKFGFVKKVAENKSFTFKRYELMEYSVFEFECPLLSSMLEHGEMIFLGNTDGTIDIYRPRDLKLRNAVKTIDLKTYVKDLENTAIVAMEVFEDNDTHYLFVATESCVYHFKIDYPDPDRCMWAEFPLIAEMTLGYNTGGQRHPF